MERNYHYSIDRNYASDPAPSDPADLFIEAVGYIYYWTRILLAACKTGYIYCWLHILLATYTADYTPSPTFRDAQGTMYYVLCITYYVLCIMYDTYTVYDTYTGMHRALGSAVSRIKSVVYDRWEPEMVLRLIEGGNDRAAEVADDWWLVAGGW